MASKMFKSYDSPITNLNIVQNEKSFKGKSDEKCKACVYEGLLLIPKRFAGSSLKIIRLNRLKVSTSKKVKCIEG